VKDTHPGQTDTLFTYSTGLAVLKQLVAESVRFSAHIQHSRMLYVQKNPTKAGHDVASSACLSYTFGAVLT